MSRIGLRDNPWIYRLVAFGLDCDDYVIFGSAPLLAHGIRQRISDLDVVVRGAAWRRVSDLGGTHSVGAVSGGPTVHFWDGRIQFSPEWISQHWDTDDLIDRAEIIDGLPFARLTDVLGYKQELMRPKDMWDIRALKVELGGAVVG